MNSMSATTERDVETAVGAEKPANTSYEQHDDPDVIIPFRLSRPLVYSAHLLLINGIVALVFGDYGLFAVLFFVYCTSIVHWSKPRFSAIARFVDYFAVLCAVTYGSVFVVLLEEQNVKEAQSLITMWFVGLCIIAVIFVCNESSFYFQVMKSPTGNSMLNTDTSSPLMNTSNISGTAGLKNDNSVQPVEDSGCLWLKVTYPNTPEREWVYKRTVIVHLCCIHVFANTLAFVLIIMSS